MIFHINRIHSSPNSARSSAEQVSTCFARRGKPTLAVQSYVVGPDLGGEFEWGARVVLEDLDGSWEVPDASGARPLRNEWNGAHRPVRGLRHHGLR